MKKLNVGCGKDIRKGWVNLDYAKFKGVDIIHDLNKFPYPFKDNEFDEILASHIIEHLPDTIGFIDELYRISADGGSIVIKTPFWNHRNTWVDPTHIKTFCAETFLNLEYPECRRFGSKARLKVKRLHLKSGRLLGLIPISIRRFLSVFFCSIFYEIECEFVVSKK